ncbi:hypothetical protein GQ464_010135 [Rhodocaloribacter litoris]|uniref:glycoside hydrolase family 113 n=1 Tax=Rhodocaloribacter litoris TaxID=2558931 RepID=UPI00141FCB6A|nr:hypothetical protein [Rhodocaloribacter litoris]QXD13831.1 hypothetical protein GQ464_010135 [Rhodocaloribacter litoris]
MTNLRFLLTAGLGGVLVAGLVAAFGWAPFRQEDGAARPDARIRAVTLDARHPPADSLLDRLAGLGVTHVAVIPYAFQPDPQTPALRHNPDGHWYAESDAGIRDLAGRLRARGLGLILKPQLWMRGAWTADLTFDSEAAWTAWERAYRDFILHYARLAAGTDAALLVVGTELARAVRTREAFWRRLIADVRTLYGGPLTYAANWHDDFEHVPFWDALDYVGVQAYFPLAETDSPSLATLRAGWAPHRAALERIARRTGRPVLLTELGYRSVSYAAAEPWRWPSRDEYGHLAPDFDLQARLFQAFFDACWDAPWLAGVIIWKWQADPGRRPRDLDFTPQDKPAEQVLRAWFRSTG